MDIKFDDFLQFFPEIQLPITLREDTYEELSVDIPPLPAVLIDYYILAQDEVDDGMTEFIPCFRLPEAEHYVGVVYWKAGLMSYEYILKTYTKDGEGVIDSHVIGGTVVNGTELIQSLAMIAADNSIYIATGALGNEEMDFDVSKNKTSTIEINDDGTLDV
jgi:hypothetical protein